MRDTQKIIHQMLDFIEEQIIIASKGAQKDFDSLVEIGKIKHRWLPKHCKPASRGLAKIKKLRNHLRKILR